MSLLPKWCRIARGGRSTDSLQSQVEEELRFHVEMLERESLDEGLAPDKARAAARRRFGDFDKLLAAGLRLRRDNGRRQRRARLLEELAQDLQHGARALLRDRVFGIAAAFVIAVGIGIVTAAFAVANAVLFRPLPLPHPDRLVAIDEGPGETTMPDLRNWQERSKLVEGFAASRRALYANLTGTDDPERLRGYLVSTSYFHVVGTPLFAGRLFRDEGRWAHRG